MQSDSFFEGGFEGVWCDLRKGNLKERFFEGAVCSIICLFVCFGVNMGHSEKMEKNWIFGMRALVGLVAGLFDVIGFFLEDGF